MKDSTAIRKVHIFGDESSHTGKHKYLVYGTVSCERDKIPMILAELNTALKGQTHEWHWSGSHHRSLYPGFVDAIFKCRDRHGLRYRCLVVNKHHARHAEYNNRDPDLGLEKYIFYHLRNYAQNLNEETRFYATLDKRSSKYKGEVQKITLNARLRTEAGIDYDLFEEVEDVESDTSVMVQAADVISGAVSYVMNERYLAKDASPQKLALAEHVALRAAIPSVGQAEKLKIKKGDLRSLSLPTPKKVIDGCGFASWHLNLRKREQDVRKAYCKEQLAQFPRDMTYGGLRDLGYQVALECVYCDRQHNDYMSMNGNFASRSIRKRPIPFCRLCGRVGIVSLTMPRQGDC